MTEITSGNNFKPNSPRELKLEYVSALLRLKMTSGNAVGPNEVYFIGFPYCTICMHFVHCSYTYLAHSIAYLSSSTEYSTSQCL